MKLKSVFQFGSYSSSTIFYRLSLREYRRTKTMLLPFLVYCCLICLCSCQLTRTDKDTTTYLENGFGRAEIVIEFKTQTPNVNISSSHIVSSKSQSILAYNISHKLQQSGVIEFRARVLFVVPGTIDLKLTVESSNWDYLEYRSSQSISTVQNVLGVALLAKGVPLQTVSGKEYRLRYTKYVVEGTEPVVIQPVVYPLVFSHVITLANVSVISIGQLLLKNDAYFQKNGMLVLRLQKYRTGNATVVIDIPRVYHNVASNQITLIVNISSNQPPPPVVVSGRNLVVDARKDHRPVQISLNMYNVPKNVLDVMVFSQNISFSLNKKLSVLDAYVQKVVIEAHPKEIRAASLHSNKMLLNSVYVRMSHGLAVQAVISKPLFVTFLNSEEKKDNAKANAVIDKCESKTDGQCPPESDTASDDSNDSDGKRTNETDLAQVEGEECFGSPEGHCTYNDSGADHVNENNIVAIVIVSVLAAVIAIIICFALVKWWRSRSVYYPWPGPEKNDGSSPPFGSDNSRRRSAFVESP